MVLFELYFYLGLQIYLTAAPASPPWWLLLLLYFSLPVAHYIRIRPASLPLLIPHVPVKMADALGALLEASLDPRRNKEGERGTPGNGFERHI